MPEKVAAWVRQAAHDLDHARAAQAAGHHDWACRAAGEAAECAIKAVLRAHDAKMLGVQNLLVLLARARDEAGAAVPDDLMEDARDLMPLLGVLSGQCTYGGVAPCELIARAQGDAAIAAAQRIVRAMTAAACVSPPGGLG